MSSRFSPSDVSSLLGKKIFFDANILIYLFGFGIPSRQDWEGQYATLYTNLNGQNNQFVIDYIVVSEFVNRAIKLEYKNYLTENNISTSEFSYKKYRNSHDGKEALKDIYLILKNEILKEFEIVEKKYSKDDLSTMCIIDNLDFSDKAIVKICDENQFVLLTNDLDFRGENIDILSCHRNF